MSLRPACPVSLPPPTMGCGSPFTSPTRREKNAVTGKSKNVAPSRKNVRRSGKKIGNRVRFTRRRSTSVSAKSVFTVATPRSDGVML